MRRLNTPSNAPASSGHHVQSSAGPTTFLRAMGGEALFAALRKLPPEAVIPHTEGKGARPIVASCAWRGAARWTAVGSLLDRQRRPPPKLGGGSTT